MGLRIDVSVGLLLYIIVLVVLMFFKKKEQIDSTGYKRYSTMVTIWLVIGFFIFIVICISLGGGPILQGILNAFVIEQEIERGQYYGNGIYNRVYYN